MRKLKDNHFLKLAKIAGISPTQALMPVGFAISASLMEAIHVATLFPMIEGILSLNFSSVANLPLIGTLIEGSFLEGHSNILFFLILCLVLFSGLTKLILSFYSAVFMARLVRRLTFSLRCRLFDSYLSASKKYYDKHSSGSVHQILMTFTQSIGNTLFHLQGLGTTLFMTIVYGAIMFTISWKITMATILFLPIINLLMTKIIRRISLDSEKYASIQQHLGKRIFNVLVCIPLVKSACQQEREQRSFVESCEKIKTLEYGIDKKSAFIQPFQEMVALIALIVVLFSLSGLVINGREHHDIAKLVLLFYALRRAVNGFSVFNTFKSVVAEIRGPSISILNALSEQEENAMPDVERALQERVRKIEFRDFHFSYENNVKVLKDINFTFEKEKMYALVGPTGSGKSTLIGVLTRFYDCEPGEIFINDEDIRSFSINSVRRKISVVTQAVFLFHESIRYNLTYGIDRELTEEEIDIAIENAQLKPFIQGLPQGLDTVIGEQGVLLSGGEKQRLTIARAFLEDSEMLILDEATSSLDVETEGAVQKALEKLLIGKMAIIIAHRLSTIKNVDQIIFLEKGKIAETGSFVNLVKSGGRFKDFLDRNNLAQ